MSQEYAVARVDAPVAPTTDVDKAQKVAGQAARASSQKETTGMLGPVEMLGVQEVSATQVILRVTVKTKANAQWAVQRRLRRDILRALVDNRIALPSPLIRTG